MKKLRGFYLLPAMAWVAIALFAAPLSAEDTALPITGVEVVVDPVPGSGPGLDDMARALISMEPGNMITPQAVQDAMATLKASGRFSRIHADVAERPEGPVLFLRLTPYPLIRDIRVSGAYPLFTKTVLGALTLLPGDAYRPTEVEKQREYIGALYRREGFLAPRVWTETRPHGPWDYLDLTYHIAPGPYHRLGQIVISGNHAISDTRIRLGLKTWRLGFVPGSGGRFTETDLKEDIKWLTERYRDIGFAEARIEPVVKKNLETGTVTLTLDIFEGPKYEVRFSGNQAVSNRQLKKKMVLKTEGNPAGDRGVRKSVKQIREHYGEKGFLDARIAPLSASTPAISSDRRLLEIEIQEGPRTRVRTLVVKGNRFFSEKKILDVVLTRTPGLFERGFYLPQRLDADLLAIKELYLSEGFLDPRIEKTVRFEADRASVDITITISENVRTLVAETSLFGSIPMDREELHSKLSLKLGTPYRPYMVQSDENTLSEAIAEKGYPHVQVTGTSRLSEDATRADVHYRVDPGPLVRMGGIWYRGNFKTQAKTLDRQMLVKAQEPLSLKKLLESERRIRNMDLFDAVRFTHYGLSEKADEVHVFADLEEVPPYFTELGVGYESDTGFFSRGKIGDRNVMGRNRSLWLAGEYSQTARRVEGNLSDPWLFGTAVLGSAGAFWERVENFNQSFGTETIGASLSLKTDVVTHLSLALKTQYEFRNLYLREDTPLAAEFNPEDLDYRKRVLISPMVQYDTRDSFIRPRKGLLASASMDLSKGIEETSDDFARYDVDTRFYHSPVERMTLALFGRSGILTPYGSNDTVPVDQLFYLGGTSNVRGFSENELLRDLSGDALGGRNALSGSLEMRLALSERYEAAVFLDAGRLSDTQWIDAPDDFRFSAGLGLRYITPIGPIGLLYGWKLDPGSGEDPGRFHFSVGYTF